MTAITLAVCNLKNTFVEERLRTAWSLCQKRHPNLRNKISGGAIVAAETTSVPVIIENGDIDELFGFYTNEVVPVDREPAPSDLIVIIHGKNMFLMVRMLHSLRKILQINISFERI